MGIKKVKPSPAMIVALIALFVALSGGAYAAVKLSNNSVLSKHIKNGQVRTQDLAKDAVTSAKIKDSQVVSADLADNSVGSADLADSSVGSADLADNSVASSDIADGSIALGDLASSTTTDLNDASTVGGLSVAQIVAAAGGKYAEARQAPGSVNVNTLTDQTLATLNLPEAGKYLISARMPVNCTYDLSGPAPVNGLPPNTDQIAPYFVAKAKLFVGGTLTDTIVDSCQAEASNFVLVAPSLFGTKTVEITRQIDVTGPTTVQLKGLAETSLIFVVLTVVEVPSAARVTATASGAMIQAISVRT